MSTLKTLFESWIKKMQARIDSDRYTQGYNWCSGVLLRGEITPLEVKQMTYTFQNDHFLLGTTDALKRLEGIVPPGTAYSQRVDYNEIPTPEGAI